ncbi:hypothetical protein [Azospirillum sp. sgz301742]
MTEEEVQCLFISHFKSARAIGLRMLASKTILAPMMPVDPAWLDEAGVLEYLPFDAFIQQFGSMQDTLHGSVFRGVLELEQYTDKPKTPRDLADLMEKLGIIDDAAAWHELRKIRNALAHEYTDHRVTQARRLNEAYAAIDDLITVLNRVHAYVTAKGLADLSAYPPL